MTDLEKFLRQATRGLWGKERQTVHKELESHVRQRAQRYELSGASETEAIQKAIADLGEAQVINAGMRNAYLIPTTIRACVLVAAVAVMMVIGAHFETGVVMGTTQFPTPDCIEKNLTTYTVGGQTYPCEQRLFYLSLDGLRKTLEPLGVTFEEKSSETISLRFPEGRTALLPSNIGPWKAEDEQHKLHVLPIVPGYIHVLSLVQGLRNSGLPVKISGWDRPKITVGQTEFVIRLASQKVRASSVYLGLISVDLMDVSLESVGDPQFGSSDVQVLQPKRLFTHTIRTPVSPGNIVVVFSDEGPTTVLYKNKRHTLPAFQRGFVAPVGADGSVQYPSVSRTLAVVSGKRRDVSAPNGRGEITVVRFTGEYGTRPMTIEPIAAAAIKIESR